MAQRGVLDVPGDERRYPQVRGALRLHVEPQLRRAPGARRSHPSDEPADGRGGCGRRPARRRARMGVGAGGGARRVVIEPFVRHSGAVAALPRADVDTDQIIPKQFLKRVERTGFGPALFYDWRFRPDGSVNSGFELNRPEAQGATILVAGANFGCGSSREHAVWALSEYGFRAILAPSFADIFYANFCQNGVLAVRLSSEEIAELLRRHAAAGGVYRLSIDLVEQRVEDGAGFAARFAVEAYRREMLLHGLDEIGRTLLEENRIAAYECGMRNAECGIDERPSGPRERS